MEEIKTIKIDIVSISVFSLFIVFTAISGFWIYDLVREKTKEWNITSMEGAAIVSDTIDEDDADGPIDPSDDSTTDILLPAIDPWDGSSRVNILVLGLDYRDWIEEEHPLSDSMMLVTFDPVNLTAGMLSIPRDLWVEIPGFGKHKINQAYQFGEGAKLPGGGAELARQTVEGFLGTPVDYYVVLDFNSFIEFIDLISGVKISVTEYQVIDLFGSSAKLYLKPEDGEIQSLNGHEALSYARYRGSEGGDFDRALKQQEIVFAIRDKVLEPEWQSYLLTHYEEVWDIFKDSVKTNLALDEIVKLGLSAKDVERDNIKTGVIGPPSMVMLSKSPDGLDILVPITPNIRILRDEIFSVNALAAPMLTDGELLDLLIEENATVGVYNGTYTTGLAALTQQYLESFGVNVVSIGDGVQTAYTTIYSNGKVPYTLKYLVDDMNITEYNIRISSPGDLSADIEIILGSDWFVPSY